MSAQPTEPADPIIELRQRHAAARARREASALGSDEFRAAAEEIARIEIEIAAHVEPPIEAPSDVAAGPAARPPGG